MLQARDRQIALDAAAFVQELGVGNAARGPVHLVGSEPLQQSNRPRSSDLQLTEGGDVEQPSSITSRLMLRGDGRGPVLGCPAAWRMLDRGRLLITGKPV